MTIITGTLYSKGVLCYNGLNYKGYNNWNLVSFLPSCFPTSDLAEKLADNSNYI